MIDITNLKQLTVVCRKHGIELEKRPLTEKEDEIYWIYNNRPENYCLKCKKILSEEEADIKEKFNLKQSLNDFISCFYYWENQPLESYPEYFVYEVVKEHLLRRVNGMFTIITDTRNNLQFAWLKIFYFVIKIHQEVL